MSVEETENRIYVHDERYATFRCPKCGKAKTVDVSRFLKHKSKVTITYRFKCDGCSCESTACETCDEMDCNQRNRQTVLLERRRHYRKAINIPGSYRRDWDSPSQPVTIEDISVTGIQLAFRSSPTPPLIPGDQIIIQFVLPGGRSLEIIRRVVVRTPDGLRVGVEYMQPLVEDEMGKAIRFFLMT